MRQALRILTILCIAFIAMNTSAMAGDDAVDYKKAAKDMGKNQLPDDKKITQQWLWENVGQTFYLETDVFIIAEGNQSRDLQLSVDKAKFSARQKLAQMLSAAIDRQSDHTKLQGTSTIKTALRKDGDKYKAVILMKLPLKENM